MGYKEKVTPVQFKIGKKLLERIDEALPKRVSRNGWMAQAVEEYIETGIPSPISITAEELLSERRTTMIRLDPYVLEIVDEICQDIGIKRTVWILDACMSKLSKQEQK